MVETVFTVMGEAAVSEAAALMSAKRVSCLPISMGQGAVGVVTEKDIIQKVVAAGKDPRKVKVKEIMSTPLILAPANITIKEAAEKMLSHQIRRLVITGEKGKLIGLATMTDIIRWIAQGEGNPNYIVRYLSEEIG
jgi:malate dehydrogenase (oxaloacetate-decarboxylating)